MPVRKLLVVSDSMEVGGSQKQISYLLEALDRRRWQPELLFFRDSSMLVDRLREQGIVVHNIPKRGRFDLGFILKYAALMRRGRYDLVHAFSITAELWTMVAGWLALKPALLIASVRGLYVDMPGWFWLIKRFVVGNSRAVISNAQAGAEAAAARTGFPLDSFEVIPNGTALPTLPPGTRERIREVLRVPAERSFGLFVGRMVPQKNLHCLVRAMALLAPADRPWIALAGDGPLLAEIKAAVLASGLQADLHFLGERADCTALMQAADFLVLPSSHEGMPNVILEAMMAGCPVVGSEAGGIPELIQDGVTGLLFHSDDAPALGMQIRRLAADEGLQRVLAGNARQYVQAHYSIDSMVAATVVVYERCLAGTPRIRQRPPVHAPHLSTIPPP